MGLPGMTRGTFVFHANLPEAHPGTHATQDAVAFAHLVNNVQCLAVDQAKIAGIERHFDIGDLVNQLIKERGRGQLEPAFPFALGAHCVNDLVAFTPFFYQIKDHFRWILQVRVDNND